MSRLLGHRTATGKLNPSNPIGANFWTLTFSPEILGIQIQYEIYHGIVLGPADSQALLYIDNVPYQIFENGNIMSWDPNNPMLMQPGQTIYVHYNSAGVTPEIGGAPRTHLWCRESLV